MADQRKRRETPKAFHRMFGTALTFVWVISFSSSAFFFSAEVSSLGFLDCFTGQSPGIGRNKLAISIPVAPALPGSWPSPSQSSLTRGWDAAGLGGWCCGFGQELAPERIIAFNIGKLGAAWCNPGRGGCGPSHCYILVWNAGGSGVECWKWQWWR